MGVDHLTIGDAEAFGSQDFQPEVIDPGGDGTLNALFEQLLKSGEQDTLHSNCKRQETIQESGDRRQVVFEAVVITKAGASGLFKGHERTARRIAAMKAAIELPQRIASVGRLEVVLRPEQPLPANLTLATGIWCCEYCAHLRLRKVVDQLCICSLDGQRPDHHRLLKTGGSPWLKEAKKCLDRREPRSAGSHCIGTTLFNMLEEGPDQPDVEILDCSLKAAV